MMIPLEVKHETNIVKAAASSIYSVHLNTSDNTSASVPLTDKDQLLLDIERLLKIYYSMFLLFVGTVFNVLSIVILSRAAFRRTSTSVYLRFLACTDLFVLYNGLSRHFVSGISGYNIRELSEGFCKFNYWTSSFGPDTSAWILVAVTTERVVSIVWPHKVKILCSKVTAIVTLVAISVLIMASNVPILVFYGDKRTHNIDANSTQTSGHTCVPLKPEYEYFIDNAWHWIDLLKFVLLPSIILITFNTIIIYFVVRSRRRMKMRDVSSTRSDPRCASISRNVARKSFSLDQDNNNHMSGYNKEMSLTITLFVVNVTFVVFNAPVMVYFLGGHYWFPPGLGPVERLTLTASIMAMYTNNAVNFLLYCATGSKFRAEICQLLPRASRISLMQNKDSAIFNSFSSSLRKRQSQETHLTTITGSLETCHSQVSVI